MRKKFIIVGLLLTVAALALWGCGQSVVATVNGEQITAQELDQRIELIKEEMIQQGFQFEGETGAQIETMLRNDLLEQLINEKLVLQEATKRNLLPEDKDVEAEIKLIKEQLGDESNFKKYLAANGINEPKLRDMIYNQMALMKLLEQITGGMEQPGEAEIAEYYEQNKAQLGVSEQRQVSHILIGMGNYAEGANRTEVEAKTRALQVLAKLDAGEDFGQLAKEYSDDPGSKDNGGQYPPFALGGGFTAAFEEAAFSLQEGALTTEPVKTEFGYHIIRLDQVIAASVPDLDEVRDKILSDLEGQALEKAQSDFIQDLREKAEIDIRLEQQNSADDAANGQNDGADQGGPQE